MEVNEENGELSMGITCENTDNGNLSTSITCENTDNNGELNTDENSKGIGELTMSITCENTSNSDGKSIWMQLMNKVKAVEFLPATMTVDSVRQIDGGFFEKFGTLLQAQTAATRLGTPEVIKNVGELNGEAENQSGSDSEEEQPPPDEAEIFTDVIGWNVEQLYSEVLYEQLHGLGCDAAEMLTKQDSLFAFLREAFHFDAEKHEDLLAEARAKEAPDILLNVEVIEAKELHAKDCNGLSDPFCTLYMSSETTQRYNTSVKSETLAPVWEEHFSLPVENPQDETLTVEVWDFDPAESVREKLGKLSDVKGIRGMRKLMKEIAVTASTGKHDNELVGTAIIPLKSLPAQGKAMWSNLEKRGKSKRQGLIHLRMALSAAKNSQVACQEHRHLVRTLLKHEIDTTQVLPYQWSGEFCELAEQVLTQHVVQSNLDAAHENLACWAEYATVHCDHPLSFQVFGRTLEKLARPVQNGTLNDEEIKVFWDAAKKIMPSCLTCIRKLRRLSPSDKSTLAQLAALLSVLSQLTTLQPPSGFELFPASMFGWLTTMDGPNCDVRQSVMDAVRQGASEWFDHVLENNQDEVKDAEDEVKLSHLVRVVALVQSDMLRAVEHHDKIFLEVLQFPYAKNVYAIFDKKVCELCQPAVEEACKHLKPLKFNERPEDGIHDNEDVTMGTSLFELYLTLQRFSMLGHNLCTDVELEIKEFHTWFHRGVAQWLDIALYKALQRIERAIELGTLKPIDEHVKFSSSAVDTLAIFYQVKIFWKELNWPDVEGSYSFMAKIIDDICRCSVFYADRMSQRVQGMGETEDAFSKKFEVTNEWCTAINNIEYIRQSIEPFVLELGLEALVVSLSDFRSPQAAEHCKETLQLVVDNSIETVGNKIAELIETMTRKMCPAMQRFLQESAELMHQGSMSLDRLMTYLDNNLATLHEQLSEENFKRTLDIVWQSLTKQLVLLVDTSVEKRRPPSFFENLRKALGILEGFFMRGEADETDAGGGESAALLIATKARLRLYGLETMDLIHAYHLTRFEEQLALTHTPSQTSSQCCGLLTVRLLFHNQVLTVEILNARNIKPADTDGSCDPYVKIHLLPEDKFAGASKPKTRVHKKNLFPLFDESFNIPMGEDLQRIDDALVHLVVKDYDMLGSNEVVGEAFIKFSTIPRDRSSIDHLPQQHLPLTRPAANKMTDSEAFKALELRQGDKMAKEFIKKERAKFLFIK